MLECHSCLQRCLIALARASPAVSTAALLPRPAVRIASSRLHTSTQRSRGVLGTESPKEVNSDLPALRSTQLPQQHFDPPQRPQTWGEGRGKARGKEIRQAVNGTESRRLRKEFLETELKYLKDPLKLADHIKHVLQANDEEKALALVRLSSKALANTVSWNHVIDWQMKHGKTKAALETYNEMKKRAQRPDNFTYTLLLRGLAEYAHYPGSLGRALSIYHGMFGPNSKISPNIMHVNAVLKVCARSNDTESMWDIVSKLPDRGPLAADAWTFSTLFNYMRYQALTDAGSPSEAGTAQREKLVIKARQLWGAIVARWREGDLKIDENVVCAMGRILRCGSHPRDWDDILSLVTQTTQIPRMVPRLGDTPPMESPAPSPALAPPSLDLRPSTDVSRDYDDAGREFDPIVDASDVRRIETVAASRRRGFAGHTAFVQPGPATLALVVEACEALKSKSGARNYWDLLTRDETYGVVPDEAGITTFLRVLRFFRSSTEAAELVCEHMPQWELVPSRVVFRLAMRTCVRDKENPHAMRNAMALMDAMHRTLADPDMRVMELFLALAGAWREPEGLRAALGCVDRHLTNLRSAINFGLVGGGTGSAAGGATMRPLNGADRDMAVKVLQVAIGCYDKALHPDTGVQGSGRGDLLERKARLAAFVTRYRNRWAERKVGKTTWTPADKGVVGITSRRRNAAAAEAAN